MPTDFQALRQLIDFSGAGVAEERLASGVAAAIEPFCAASETLPLRPASEIDVNRLILALSAATGKTVKNIVFVDRLLPRVNREKHQIGRRTVDLSGDTAVRENDLGGTLAERLREELGPPFAFCLDQAKQTAVNAALWRHLWQDLRPRLQRLPGEIVSATVRDGIWVGLLYLLGFAHHGNAKRVQQLLPLFQILPYAVPLGEARDEPGTWFVLTAP